MEGGHVILFALVQQVGQGEERLFMRFRIRDSSHQFEVLLKRFQRFVGMPFAERDHRQLIARAKSKGAGLRLNALLEANRRFGSVMQGLMPQTQAIPGFAHSVGRRRQSQVPGQHKNRAGEILAFFIVQGGAPEAIHLDRAGCIRLGGGLVSRGGFLKMHARRFLIPLRILQGFGLLDLLALGPCPAF